MCSTRKIAGRHLDSMTSISRVRLKNWDPNYRQDLCEKLLQAAEFLNKAFFFSNIDYLTYFEMNLNISRCRKLGKIVLNFM